MMKENKKKKKKNSDNLISAFHCIGSLFRDIVVDLSVHIEKYRSGTEATADAAQRDKDAPVE
jgi:hypothetical protein